MSKVLDGITLNPDLIWTEEFQSTGKAMSMKRTLGGAPVIFTGDLGAGLSITLSSGSPNGSTIGVLKKSVVDLLIARAEVLGAQYTLEMNGTDYSVVFDWRDGKAVEFTPLVTRPS